MDEINRRNFLKTALFTTCAATALPALASEAEDKSDEQDRMGVLVDTTVCVGCRNCEWACKTAHGKPTSDLESYTDRTVFKTKRRPNYTSLTVVNEFENPANPLLPIDVKYQCMHCEKPACVSACIVGAITKKPNGAVVWDGDKCIGCRYCMVACPFQVPSFEFNKALKPDICKCDFCYQRTGKGLLPACVDICPCETLTYGPRVDLLKLAKERIRRKPDLYVDKIFGEYEVGGTSWMYLSSNSIYNLDLPRLGDKTAPGVSEAIQHGIFAYFFPPVALYSLLGGMMWFTKRRQEIKEDL